MMSSLSLSLSLSLCGNISNILLHYLHNIGITLGVDFLYFCCSLWGGAVLNLGTKKHKDKYYDGIDNLEYPGCFAMTELHHGKLF
jgi:alkylation response protein AidB-like acyl-CoA dehydrogenase